MLTLAIDTSTSTGSVAVFAFDDIVFEETFTADRSHSSALFVTLEKAKKRARRIDQVAIGLGPGSYAGVRIAIAGALGLQLGLGAVLVGIPSVAALATDATSYLAVGDARRETFYFTLVVDGICREGPTLLTEHQLRIKLDEHSTLPVLSSSGIPAFPTVQIAAPSAAKLARLAAAGRGIVAEGDLEPLYLREPHITQPRLQ
ncbi:MAG TPA: tRNA (adenosine(37)-N6)-threonylcarbamoyltransferase complex dimerization subunit type 1 TsaB [Chthoniobacteraceae bacterium]|jgi:tRNA threonylcarbamoyl adenosine modification protein YeaZ